MDVSGQMFLCMLSVLMCRCLDVSIAKYRFRQYFYYHHSLLIMFGIEASAQINLDDAMSSFAMPTNSCCTIRLRLTFLRWTPKVKWEKELKMCSFGSFAKMSFHHLAHVSETFQEITSLNQRLNGNSKLTPFSMLYL